MKLSFVIPAYNEEKYIGDCLSSLLKEIKKRPYEIEVIVVNNASIDKTADVARTFSGIRVVDEPKKGLTIARQKGLAEAKGELLAYIDADTRMPSEWFSKMEKMMFNEKSVVSYSGPYRYYDAPKYDKLILELLWKIFAPLGYWLSGYTVLGGNFVARKEALFSMGGFDTSIKFFGEDMDIAKRLSKFGKVKFDMDFFIYASSRRFLKDGILKVSWIYAINFIWQVLFSRPYTKEYKD